MKDQNMGVQKSAPNILLGLVSLDIYISENIIRPGGGILHNAFHLQQLGKQPLLLTRVGHTHPEPFLNFIQHHHISFLPDVVVDEGQTASIEITVQKSGGTVVANFDRGLGHNFQLSRREENILSQATNLHLVLIDVLIPEFLRLARLGLLDRCFVSADLLSFNYFTLESFTRLIPHLDLVFIGWRRALSDPMVEAIGKLAYQHRKRVIMTLGGNGIKIFDNGTSKMIEVQKIPVQGSTNGCGDAFIAYFLAEYWHSHHLGRAVERGKVGGARATEWLFALPPSAYLDEGKD